MDEQTEQKIRFAKLNLMRFLDELDFSQEDAQKLDRASEYISQNNCTLFEALEAQSLTVSTGIWFFVFAEALDTWDQISFDSLYLAPDLRQIFREAENEHSAFLDAIAECCRGLVKLIDNDKDAEAALETAFWDLAKHCERHRKIGDAYDAISLAITLASENSRNRSEIARFGLEIAKSGGKSHQIACFAIESARELLKHADADEREQLNAFNALEYALEWASIDRSPTTLGLLERLVQDIAKRDYLGPLLPPAILITNPGGIPEEVTKSAGIDHWPERCFSGQNATLRAVEAMVKSRKLEDLIDQARLALEGDRNRVYRANWADWTVEHPAYSRAVPQNQSFLREANFTSNVLTLAHELTHIYCLISPIGRALSVLRVALYEAEINLWAHADMNDPQEVSIAWENDPIAPLKTDQFFVLYHAERAQDIADKICVVQDTWTPFFEGLAVYGEVSVDPSTDPLSINPVSECLRNMIDFFPDISDKNNDVKESFAEAVEQYVEQFDEAYHNAVETRAPLRLDGYFRSPNHEPYLGGYLVIRAIVARWHTTMGHRISATDAFKALLHATRFGVLDVIPSLSLPIHEFESQALEHHLKWLDSLIRLDAESFHLVTHIAERSERGKRCKWVNGKVVSAEDDSQEAAASQEDDYRKKQLREARGALPLDHVSGSRNLSKIERELRKFVREALSDNDKTRLTDSSERSELWSQMLDNLLEEGGFLPVGQYMFRFFFAEDDGLDHANLLVMLRTTERHRDSDGPSSNGLSIPIPLELGASLKQEHRQLGLPRMKVTRVIDMLGTSVNSPSMAPHIFVFEYGDWFYVQGTTPAIDAAMKANEDLFMYTQELLRRRVQPDPMRLAELQKVYPGTRGATRTLHWILKTPEWRMSEESVPIENWVASMKERLEQHQTDEPRIKRRQRVTGKLLELIWPDATFVDAIVYSGFEAVTSEFSEHRTAIIDAMIGTTTSSEYSLPGDLLEVLLNSEFDVFIDSEYGIDVRPANWGRL